MSTYGVEDAVRNALLLWNFQVRKIPECESKTPDFSAVYESENYHIEVKERTGETKKERSSRLRCYRTGSFYRKTKNSYDARGIRDIIKNATKQLKSYKGKSDSFKIIWVHFNELIPDVEVKQLESSLYGLREICGEFNGVEAIKKCYYYTHSQFYKHKEDLDAVIVSCKDPNNTIMLVNNMSPRHQNFMCSRLYQVYKQCFVCFDPNLLSIERDECLVVRGPVNRADEQAVVRHLESRYNFKWLGHYDEFKIITYLPENSGKYST